MTCREAINTLLDVAAWELRTGEKVDVPTVPAPRDDRDNLDKGGCPAEPHQRGVNTNAYNQAEGVRQPSLTEASDGSPRRRYMFF